MERPILVCAAPVDGYPAAKEHFEATFRVHYIEPTVPMLKEYLPQADAYLATLTVPLTRELIDAAPRLKVIATSSTGLDHLDIEAAAKRGIAVLSLKEDRKFLDGITATAELAWALMLTSARSLPRAFSDVCQGNWQRDQFVGHQLARKTLGILGCGRLGTIMADYGRAFRMEVIGCDKEPISLENVEMVSFDELLRRSDVLSIHVHLTEENRGLIDRHAFSRMKPGSILINTSRGAIIDEEAFLDALHNGPLQAAGVDVVTGEWRDNMLEQPLIQYARSHDNLIITPHMGGVTHESFEAAFLYIAKKLVHYYQQGYSSNEAASTEKENNHYVHGNNGSEISNRPSTRLSSHLRR
ncbi:MAG: hypothetical protein JXM70_14510 [Pirellulales bacterium]|nr:hypothetical protein [Pirellulales bacterium]